MYLDRCWPISRERNVLEIPTFVGRLHTSRAVNRTSLLVKNVKVKVTMPINAHTVNRLNTQHLPNGKAYELQTWYTDGARRPVSVTSAVAKRPYFTSWDLLWIG